MKICLGQSRLDAHRQPDKGPAIGRCPAVLGRVSLAVLLLTAPTPSWKVGTTQKTRTRKI